MKNDNLEIRMQLAELQVIIDQLRSENSDFNRRLSAQNRPGKQLVDSVKVAMTILSEHVNGFPTGRHAIHTKYSIGRRRWGWGVALLKLGYIVVDSSNYALSFNANLTVPRAYEKLHAISKDLADNDSPIKRLRPYLPTWQQ